MSGARRQLHPMAGLTLTEAQRAQIEQSPKPYRVGTKFFIPLERLIAYPKVNGLVDSVENLRTLFAEAI